MEHSARGQGFTLIELVVVITLMGILAAFAIPRFVDLKSSARAAAINGMLGSTKSASALAHAVSITTGAAPNDPIVMEGQNITMASGYPDAAGMFAAAGLDLGDEFQVQFFGINAFVVWATGTPGWNQCGFAYVRAIPPGIPAPLFLGPRVSNCQ